MTMAYINIGSNQGDRKAHIDRAVALISLLAGSNLRCSDYFESKPWGYDSTSPYLNLGVAFPTTIPPEELLDRLLAIQNSISPESHRDGAGNYIDRIIDIDLIAMDSLVVNTPRLTLPHPRMHLRDFVLIPMSQLAPNWLHPLLHLTPSQLLDNCARFS